MVGTDYKMQLSAQLYEKIFNQTWKCVFLVLIIKKIKAPKSTSFYIILLNLTNSTRTVLPVLSCSYLVDNSFKSSIMQDGAVSQHTRVITAAKTQFTLQINAHSPKVSRFLPASPLRQWWGARSLPVTRRKGRSLHWPAPDSAGRSSPPLRPTATKLWTEPCGPRCSLTWLLTWRTALCSPKALRRNGERG